jgi:hypothetical protein
MICCVLTGLSCAWTVEEPANRRQMEDLVRSVTTGIVLGTRDLPWCAPGRLEDGFGFWCSLRPDVVMCAFCFGAAQAVAAAEDSVAACAGDRRRTKIMTPPSRLSQNPGWASASSCARNVALRSAGGLVDQA